MPLYEYECSKCRHRFEVIQKFSDPPRTRCPRCKGALQKLVSAPAIQFKGSGWYVTDYAKKSSGGDSAGRSKPSKSEEKPSSASPDKPAPAVKDPGGSKKKD